MMGADMQPGSHGFDGADAWNAAADMHEARQKNRHEWAAFLRQAAEDARKLGLTYCLIDPAECVMIARHLEDTTK